MEYRTQLQKVCLIGKRRWIFVVGLVAITHLVCQSFMLPYGNALLSLLPNSEGEGKDRIAYTQSDVKSVGDSLFLNASLFVVGIKNDLGGDNSTLQAKVLDDDLDFIEDENIDNEFPSNENKDADVENMEIEKDNFILEKNAVLTALPSRLDAFPRGDSLILNMTIQKNSTLFFSASNGSTLAKSAAGIKKIDVILKDEKHLHLSTNFVTSSNDSAAMGKPVRKKMRSELPPKSVTTMHQMNRLLARNRRSSRAMRPIRASVRDHEILAAKLQIENAIIVKNDRELHAPLFRNVSMFKRSYDLMERILKVYIYKDGEKPIFHQPILKGLYASEGWFMKLMEGNKHFVVKDPRKAHLFYMPFSSRMLEYALYVRNSHNRTNLRQYLKNYAEKIAAIYPFWNRTGGADHFLVACHDWAPYETRHHMEHCIKALCNADVTAGFKIGRDISLPETYVRSARNPQRDLGGKPPSERHILAFYAGNMHGYLRPILLNYWENKDLDMKIFGPMPPGVASKMNYIHHMKSSKYCICPKGYEVNSPRVVEAIFYECVPVVISDNFVPPFFEVLNWDAFSVILAEKDIPNLKDILLSIPQERYLEMQLGVRKLQRHFLWHAKPVKYDIFHMTLHSIWYNRVFQIKLR